MEVVGVRVELPSNQPIVLLREEGGNRYLPIWIGPNEATAIATAMEGVQPARPLTHDLMRSMLDAVGALAVSVVITEMRDSVFFADLTLDSGGEQVKISSRPSDAIALAVRTGTPVFASPDVLDEAAPSFPEPDEPEEDSGLDFNIEGISLGSDSEQQKTMEQAQETVPDMPALDLSGITLDMDGATTATQAGSSGKDEKWYEVQTKFDLAKAYQEMGDNDGAKEILQEVITEGDSEQKAAAESVLASLD